MHEIANPLERYFARVSWRTPFTSRGISKQRKQKPHNLPYKGEKSHSSCVLSRFLSLSVSLYI